MRFSLKQVAARVNCEPWGADRPRVEALLPIRWWTVVVGR